jgi:Na+/proline symporter
LLGYKRQKKLVLLGQRIAALSGLFGLALALSISLIGVKWKFISFAILGFHAAFAGIAAFIGAGAKKPRNVGGKNSLKH